MIGRRRLPRDPQDVRHSPWEMAAEALVLVGAFVVIFWGVPLTLCVVDLRYCG